MTLKQQISMVLGYKGMSQATLAKAIGMSPQNFHKRLERETLTPKEMERIAAVLGAEYAPAAFCFPDGTRI